MRNVYIINPKAGKHDHTVQFMERIRAVHEMCIRDSCWTPRA